MKKYVWNAKTSKLEPCEDVAVKKVRKKATKTIDMPTDLPSEIPFKEYLEEDEDTEDNE